jgi:NADH/NAD ratio-sensing transcriptional regulator Rex
MMAALSGRTTGIGTAVENYNAVDNSKPRVTATFDAAGNRTGVVLDGS